MGVILAQHYRKSKAGLQIQSGRTPEQLEKEVKQVLLGIYSKGEHDRWALGVVAFKYLRTFFTSCNLGMTKA